MNLSRESLTGTFYKSYVNVLDSEFFDQCARQAANLDYKRVATSNGDKPYAMGVVHAERLGASPESPLVRLHRQLCRLEWIAFLGRQFNVPLSGRTEINLWSYGPGDFLAPHLDKEFKRLTLLLYLNSNWNAAWGGQLRVFDDHSGNQAREIDPLGNSAVFLKRTTDSWHEVRPITDPNRKRFSLQVIYL